MLEAVLFFFGRREGEREGKDAKKKKKVVGSQVVGSMTWIVGHVPIINECNCCSGAVQRIGELSVILFSFSFGDMPIMVKIFRSVFNKHCLYKYPSGR